MEAHVVEVDAPVRKPSTGLLVVLKQVQKMYEEKMASIEQSNTGCKKLQMQVSVLRSWVDDLMSQNTLLVQAVEDLEGEATNKVMMERRKTAEDAKCSKKIAGQSISEMKNVNDFLKLENTAKEREIRRLNKDLQQYEQNIMSLRNELTRNRSLLVARKDAEMMTVSCFEECELLQEVRERKLDFESQSQNQSQAIESVRTLRKVNVALSEETHALRRVCLAMDQQCRAAAARAQFKDDIIRELRRQLKKAKTKLKEQSNHLSKISSDGEHNFRPVQSSHFVSLTSSRSHKTIFTKRAPGSAELPLHPDTDSDLRSLKFIGSGDDGL